MCSYGCGCGCCSSPCCMCGGGMPWVGSVCGPRSFCCGNSGGNRYSKSCCCSCNTGYGEGCGCVPSGCGCIGCVGGGNCGSDGSNRGTW